MSGFQSMIQNLEARDHLSREDRARLRALKLRQARLERRLADVRAAAERRQAVAAERREALAAETRRLGMQELAETLPMFRATVDHGR